MKKTIQPRKQRKRRYEAPLHRRQKMVAAPLSKELRKKFNRRSLPLRKGDKVEVMRGEFKGIKSTVREVDLKKLKVILEDVKRKKTDGTEVRVPLDPSNLMIIEPDMSDKKRQKLVKRVEGKVEVKPKKLEKKEEKKKEEVGFKCPVCGERFENKRDLNVHLETQKEFKTVG